MTRIWWILIRALKSLKNLHFDWSFLVMFDLKTYRGVYFMTLEVDAKFEEKLTCVLENNVRNLKFSPEYLKVSKLGVWWDSFFQSWKCMSLKFTGKLFCHNNEEWCKIGRGIDLSFQNWHESFDKFWPEYLKISKFHFNGLPLTKVYHVWVKKVHGSYVWCHWILTQNLKGNWLSLSKMTWGNWEIFTRAPESLQIGTLIKFFYLK